MPLSKQRVVIVGGGQAAAQTAIALRSGGFIGDIVIIGAETQLPYERPPLSKALLLDSSSPPPHIVSQQVYDTLAIKLRLGVYVTKLDRDAKCVLLADGTREEYDCLVLATGSRLRALEIEGYPSDRIFYLRTLDDSRKIEQLIPSMPSIALIGGGFIGLEAAASLNTRGCKVTIVEKADRLLPRVGSNAVSDLVLDHHRRAGIDVKIGTGVVSGGSGYLCLDDGAHVKADFVIVGIGIVPETQLAVLAQLEVDDGIVVDECCRTSDPQIYAAGDVTRGYHRLLGMHFRLESWQNANIQAQAVASSILGADQPTPEAPWAWSDQGSLNLQVAGAPLEVDHTFIRKDPANREALTVLQIFDDQLVGGCTINQSKDMAIIRRILAAGGSLALAADQLADVDVPLRKFLTNRKEQ